MNYQKILIRYGELVLKKKNRSLFISILKQNIQKILDTKVEDEFDRMFVEYKDEFLDKLKFIPGISSFSPVKVCEKKLDKIEQEVLEETQKNTNEFTKTFKIISRRSDKNFELNSLEMNNYFGSLILKNFELKVDVKNPDLSINIEVGRHHTFVFCKTYYSLGGLPVSSSGKSLHLLSGGIDSPVAAIELMKRGIKVEFLAFVTPPHTDEKTVNKLMMLKDVFNKFQHDSKIHLVNYTKIMNYISLISDQSYKIALMRRSFYRIADKIAKRKKIMAISNGENLGQVASQTIESMICISSQTNLLIFRPLLAWNKVDIINLGQKYKTYQISTIPASESCELFAPEKPVIKPTISKAEELEKELEKIFEYEDELVESVLSQK
ncbi:tRNA uracil 4-sulfurtransferase ThiI [Mycoplasmopsis pulmonis]|uniref:tRNA uracil 4-sulfurtransferase ThiI n=1 Tax=Mycoplasmopsis pulmonis TaxID=2107 RepID=UPI002ACD9017|nr:tRNA uracil 4-sulfurtransferase ThiI [Mycoplasmopsis pulmonis]MDZ7293430.1 tRNA 4-thiouridine(8) synthase ThiI [Mycoplasmopsis pulmonis]